MTPGVDQQHFLLDGAPVRMPSPETIPQILTNGIWQPFRDTFRFVHEAVPVSPEEFAKATERR